MGLKRLMIRIVHATVPGRTRFKVSELHGSDTLKKHFEIQLLKVHFIQKVSASPLTGNVLVFYDTDQKPSEIKGVIESLLILWSAADTETKKTGFFPDALREPDPGGIEKAAVDEAIPFKLKEWFSKIHRLLTRPQAQKARSWYLKKAGDVLTEMAGDAESGLTAKDVRLRQDRFGLNRLPESKSRSGWQVFMDQINSLPTYLLAAAAAVSVFTGGLFDALVIMGVVAANAYIGYQTESEAEKTIESLKEIVRPVASVLREGKVRTEPVEDVVIGDVLILKPGSYVAADCRIFEAADLSIDESMLTGESMPVFKHTRSLRRRNVPLGDQLNMAFMGTQVTGGQGRAMVVSTGCYTEIGKLQKMLQDTDRPETPIERQLRIMGDQLVILCGLICGIVFFLGFLRGYGPVQMLRMAISLAASAVPEGLPAAATINFALGIRNLQKHRVLIRRLQAVETLGAIQTLCLDKTGTLTWNRMAVQRIFSGGNAYTVSGNGILLDKQQVTPEHIGEIRDLMRVCVLCSETKVKGNDVDHNLVLRGSSTENALVQLAIIAGVDPTALRNKYPLLNLNYRTESRHFMFTCHAVENSEVLFAVKGSPPEVLALCTRQMKNNVVTELTEYDRHQIDLENEQMAGRALRVLGFAFCVKHGDGENRIPHDLVWLGLVGMADPIRDGVRDLIGNFHQAGIKTVMITGDQSATAYAVAREVGISGEDHIEILDSSELSTVKGSKLKALALKAHVYSRVSPADKLEIVQALQSAGRTVGMTGDGINDGPALKAADLGIAMGESGTDVARETADVVLEDDNLGTLIEAVRDGRGTYINIRKSVHFFLSTNTSEIMVMFAAMAAGIGFPLNVMQLLWINIISDIFPALALCLEPPETDVMKHSPRDKAAPLFSAADFRRMAFESSVISAGSLGAYAFGLLRYGAGRRAGTLAFQSLTIGQLLHALCCRSENHAFWQRDQLSPNRYLGIAIGGSLLLQLLTFFTPPLQGILGITPLSPVDMLMVGGCAALPLLINETTKVRGIGEK
jgi:P-type Ca2+ transporter type 2C